MTKNQIRRLSVRSLLLSLALALCLSPLLFVSGCAEDKDADADANAPVAHSGDQITLYVYNWGEYISDGSEGTDDTNAMFEEWMAEQGYDVKVNYSTYVSNEALYAKIQSGTVNYDVIVPSDYMISRMIAEDLLVSFDEIDYKMQSLGNLREGFYDASYEGTLPASADDYPYVAYDPACKYSVPYMYGMVGIIYNTEMIAEDDPSLGSWKLMWDERHAGNILQFNNPRDAFGTAQYYLGIDVNTQDEAEWRAALDKLKEQKPILQGYVMDEIYNKMENGSAGIAAYYAGDYLTMYENNESLEFFYPEEGTNLYVDAMCIPKSSQNKEIAAMYIDFMLQKDPAIANALYTYYASPNKEVVDDEGYMEEMNAIKEDAYDKMYPNLEGMETSSYQNLPEEKLLLLNSLWEELKSDVTVSGGIYILCGVIVAGLIGLWIFFAARKKIRNIY